VKYRQKKSTKNFFVVSSHLVVFFVFWKKPSTGLAAPRQGIVTLCYAPKATRTQRLHAAWQRYTRADAQDLVMLQNPNNKNPDTKNPDKIIRLSQNPVASKSGCFKIRMKSGIVLILS
jgi:hypothetical protein